MRVGKKNCDTNQTTDVYCYEVTIIIVLTKLSICRDFHCQNKLNNVPII